MTAAEAGTRGQVTLREVRARGRIRGVTGLLGPAFAAPVACVDPGNFTSNLPTAPSTAMSRRVSS